MRRAVVATAGKDACRSHRLEACVPNRRLLFFPRCNSRRWKIRKETIHAVRDGPADFRFRIAEPPAGLVVPKSPRVNAEATVVHRLDPCGAVGGRNRTLNACTFLARPGKVEKGSHAMSPDGRLISAVLWTRS